MPETFSQHIGSSLPLTRPGRYDEVRNQTLRLAEMPTIGDQTIQSMPDSGAFVLTPSMRSAHTAPDASAFLHTPGLPMMGRAHDCA
ncbi:hypothetical protein [Nitrosospira sp. Nsp1]|uniref:hypothetical protein n=1 Tax=Nitrosospira sp. Nsp1 TaxID=136547 RepID=UPI00115F7F4F|nr:hypothetical protein [Nitrosospira sp. Nsp1]